MKCFQKIFSMICVLMTVLAIPFRASAASEELSPYLNRLINYYLHYQNKADTEIDTLVEYVGGIDPVLGETWEDIMESWDWCNSQMPVYQNILPDGLPQDNSLCIVVLGYDLKDDGSMKEELVDRLVVALASSLKYPNAYVAVTGGATSKVKGVTEAGQMAAWLKEHGLPEERLIVEKQALSTTKNAMNLYRIFSNSYPEISSVAVVSSDYHIPWGCSMFTTVSHYNSGVNGGRKLELVGNACNVTGKTMNTLLSQAKGIATITGVPFDGSAAPALYIEEETTGPPAAVTVKAVEEPETKGDRRWIPVTAGFAAAAVTILLFPTKKNKKKSG